MSTYTLTVDSHASPHSRSTMPLKESFKRWGSKKDKELPIAPRSPHNSTSETLSRNMSNLNMGPQRTSPTRRPLPREAPPAYSPAPPAESTPAPAQSATVTSRFTPGASDTNTNASTAADSQYAFLAQFDTVFLIDDSGSMAGRSWRETSEALAAITPICTEQDADGIDIYFLNHHRQNSDLGAYNNVTTTNEVKEIFSVVRPGGATPTGTRLNKILRPYLAKVEQATELIRQGKESSLKPLNIIVITDGEPTDDVTSVIVQAAKKLDKFDAEPWQVGIQFFQVGCEPGAAESLRELDDELSEEFHIRDMVDTVPWNGEQGTQLTAQSLLKIVLGSVHRKFDRRRVLHDLSRA